MAVEAETGLALKEERGKWRDVPTAGALLAPAAELGNVNVVFGEVAWLV